MFKNKEILEVGLELVPNEAVGTYANLEKTMQYKGTTLGRASH